MLFTLLGFVCVGIKLFLQQHNKKLIVNSKQQKHSLVGLVSQTLLQVVFDKASMHFNDCNLFVCRAWW